MDAALDAALPRLEKLITEYGERHGFREGWEQETIPRMKRELVGDIKRLRAQVPTLRAELRAQVPTLRANETIANIMAEATDEVMRKTQGFMGEAARATFYEQSRDIETIVPRPVLQAAIKATVPLPQIEALFEQRYNGFKFAERFGLQSARATEVFRETLVQGIIEGRSTEKINLMVREALGVTQRRADGTVIRRKGIRQHFDTAVRTEISRAAELGRETALSGYRSVLQGVECLETLDDRTCPICGPYDGKKYYYEPQSGQESYDSRPLLPRHPRCRGSYAPIPKSLDDIGKELDIDFSGIELGPGMRASKGGPVKLTWDEWFAKRSPEQQVEILGRGRYELWKNGGYSLESLSRDGQLRPLSSFKAIHD